MHCENYCTVEQWIVIGFIQMHRVNIASSLSGDDAKKPAHLHK